jgi:hypothetical protein
LPLILFFTGYATFSGTLQSLKKSSTMKRILGLSILIALLFQSCLKDNISSKTTIYRPVYKTKEEVRANIKSSAPVELTAPGKIYYKDGFAFLNELYKGVHIIDIRNVASPKNIAFVNIPGAVDMAVRGNVLYADMYTDLVAIDISNPQQVKLQQVLQGVFPQRYYPNFDNDTGKIIVDWQAIDTVLQEGEYFDWGLRREDMMFAMPAAAGGGTTNGTGGSMARFGLREDRLYTVDNTDLKVFDVSIPERPLYIRNVNTGNWGIETIFPFGNNLFIGSMTGMFIYDVTAKDLPKQIGTFTHARVCDPVISDGKHAFVTLRNGSQCQGFINQLDVVDISNLTKPTLLKSYPLTNPHGLSKVGEVLVICDGADGLKLFNASDVKNIRQTAHVKGMNAYDVIAWGTVAMVSAADALYLIDFSDPAKPVIKSSISINSPK